MTGRNNHFMWKETKRIPRYSLRKLNVGVASVLLGVTIFGFNVLIDQTKVSADTTAISAKDTSTASINLDDKQTLVNKTGVVPATNNNSGSTSINSADTTASDNVDKEAISTNNEETVPSTNNTNVVPSNSMDKSAPINDDKAVQPANNAKDTTETTSVVTPTSTDPTTSNNEEASTSLPWYSFLLVTTSNNEEPSTSLPMSNQDIKLDSQPMLTEITNKPTDNWVYNNLKHYWIKSTATVKGILQTHTTNDESGRYYFAGVANYNESYHVIYLLARSNNLNDNNLYVTILHTGRYQNIQEEVVAPGESKKVEYSNGTGGTSHSPIFTNYDGTSVSIGLDGIEKGDDIQGMVVGFAYGHDTGISGDPASMGNGFMMTPMPTKVTTTIHYVDQATGDELAVPKSFEGVAYQKYTITGEAPTIDGYTLKKSPETTGYISPYKVGESYDFRLDKHVVIKQTVIDSQGLIRITAYYDGEAINNTTRYLGNMKNVNDHFSFISHGKSYTYTNQITSTNDGIVYYYAKDGSEDKSEVRIHYIDVTGNKSSLFVPGDGKEVATDKISGKLGENYNYNVNLPTDYNLATNQANTVNGTYTIDHHDEYVYVVKKTSAELDPTVPAKTKVDDPKKLTDDEKKEVAGKVTEANKDKFPEKTEVTVADDGTVTINYPDGSQDTIPGDQVVEAKKDADKTNPTVPGTKVEVKDPNNLTDEEKQQVKESIENANKDQFPEGTQVTIGNDGTATITYPDGSQDVIPGSQLVTKQGSDVANTGDVKNNGQGATASIQGATADTTAKKLPQTGEQDASATAATGLGLIILSLLGLFGLGSKKRKED
ncbi:MAG: YSIRK-type signal peptide-containing protein [Ligilactobacillus saerimneri]|nr:YSIRK-type signal peptide-containing protein [Ligilactobacillus saerimneri]